MYNLREGRGEKTGGLERELLCDGIRSKKRLTVLFYGGGG